MGGPSIGEESRANAWESRFGWRVDIMAAAAYLGGPLTGELSQARQLGTELMSSFDIAHPRDAERLRAVSRCVFHSG